METQAAFVRAKRTIHLNAKTAVHLDLPFVVDPGNAKLNHALWFDQAFQNLGVSTFFAALSTAAACGRKNHLPFVGPCLSQSFSSMTSLGSFDHAASRFGLA